MCKKFWNGFASVAVIIMLYKDLLNETLNINIRLWPIICVFVLLSMGCTLLVEGKDGLKNHIIIEKE